MLQHLIFLNFTLWMPPCLGCPGSAPPPLHATDPRLRALLYKLYVLTFNCNTRRVLTGTNFGVQQGCGVGAKQFCDWSQKIQVVESEPEIGVPVQQT